MSAAVGLMTKDQAMEFILASPNKENPSINIALFIASTALHGKTVRSGGNYDPHYLRVAMSNTQSIDKWVVGILHDVVEDSDWELEDLHTICYPDKIVDAVDGLTKRQGELYFEFAERCSLNSISLDMKLKDLKDNMDWSRNIEFPTERQIMKQKAYIVTYQYLLAVKKGKTAAGTPMNEFMASRPELNDPALLAEFSTLPYLALPSLASQHFEKVSDEPRID